MRSFLASVVIIGLALIGQQWVVKASQAHGPAFAPAPGVTAGIAAAR